MRHSITIITWIGAAALAVAGAACNGGGGDDDGNGIGPDGGGDPIDLPPMGSGVSTLSGAPTAGYVDGPRGVARFYNPTNVATGADGNIYVADFDNSLIRRVSPQGEASTVFSEDPNFFRPFGLAFVDNTTLLVQTDYNSVAERGGALWSVDINSGDKQLVADNVGRPRGLAAINGDQVLFVEYQKHVVQIIELDSKQITTIAGSFGQPGYADGSGSTARFDVPYGAVVLPGGNFLIADQNNHRLREVTPAGAVTTFAGTGMAATIDGPVGQASFNGPQALAIDDAGNVYVTERGGFVIRKIDTSGNVTTIAGSGQPGWKDSEDPNQAQFWGLEGLDVTADGRYLYVADGSRGEPDPHHYIRRVSLD